MKNTARLHSTLTAICIGALGALASPARAADHGEAPLVRLDSRLDINDLYVFQSPADQTKTVLILTVSPFAGITSPTTFHNTAAYDFFIDNNGDAKPDVKIEARFGKVKTDKNTGAETQPVRVTYSRKGKGVQKLAKGNAKDTLDFDGGTFTSGIFDDPFFFDLLGFRNGFNFTGADFFKGVNTLAIVIELPSEMLQSDPSDSLIGVWGVTRKGSKQIDRTGRPAIATALIPAPQRDAFNKAKPNHDVDDYRDTLIASITALGNAANASGLAGVLLPDIMTVDVANPAGFLNGRRLTDDVIDAELNLLTNGAVTTDGADSNDVPFPVIFPYLAPKNP